LAWGFLPIALSIVLQTMDPANLTWLRFLTAALGLAAILAVKNGLPSLRALTRSDSKILAVALGGLVGNFVLYVVALNYASPTINQVVTQLSPLLLMLGGIVVFHERFVLRQWLGFALLLVGLPLFFNRRLPELIHLDAGLGRGVALLVIASCVWAIYGLAQKKLLRRLQPQQILLLLYVGSAIVLIPAARPAVVLELSTLQLWMLVFCCANTIVAYGAFAESLQHWEASRVSAMLALTPLFTMMSMWVIERAAPGLVRPEQLNLLSFVGAGVVVAGSMLVALGSAKASAARDVDAADRGADLRDLARRNENLQ
jgi:drug/metabolite transporter (DMT)-like permease